MPLALGIDTGGTYTDGVLLDLETKRVNSKAKAFTTREDLSIGIRACIESLDVARFGDVGLVALSTTLATNAIVEGRGCRVGLILIGHEPISDLPAQQIVTIGGGHDIKGRPTAELDIPALRRAVGKMQGNVATMVISGLLSVRNPEHELLALQEVKQLWEGPVVCAHQLTTELGFHERTVTACLNARLLPIIAELLAAVKSVLVEKDIRAPLMVVKGDGSLMSEEVAREKPIQTILSGPAASIVGAAFLTERERALVLDMGGTTTDIAILEDGRPGVNAEGATVGGWRTRVEAAEISTFGVGGDSYIQVSRDGKLNIGPRRVWPLAIVAERFPNLVDELCRLTVKNDAVNYQPVDCWMLVKDPGTGNDWSQRERQIIRALQDGAHNTFVLAERVGLHVSMLALDQLEKAQVIGRVSLTPTDLLHAAGSFTMWNSQAAVVAARLQAERMHMAIGDFLSMALSAVNNSLSGCIIQSIINRQGLNLDLDREPGAALFLERFFARQPLGGLGIELHLDYPIVAVGAPVWSYLPAVGRAFHAEVLIAEHAEVANAIGAAVGHVLETVRVLIKPGTGEEFVVHAPWERKGFTHLEAAEDYAMVKAQKFARQGAQRAGASNPQLIVRKEEVITRTAGNCNDFFVVETRIEVTAVGRPLLGSKSSVQEGISIEEAPGSENFTVRSRTF